MMASQKNMTVFSQFEILALEANLEHVNLRTGRLKIVTIDAKKPLRNFKISWVVP